MNKIVDIRVLRTKNLIIESFLALVKEKDFDSITVKDITERATINRATFYSHFPDKYILLEQIINQMMLSKGFEQVLRYSEINEETFQLLVYSVCDLVQELKQAFGRNYNTIVIVTEKELRDKLIDLISTFFKSKDIEYNKMIATMLVSSIYSASCAWINGNNKIPRETFFKSILPFLMGSISQLTI